MEKAKKSQKRTTKRTKAMFFLRASHSFIFPSEENRKEGKNMRKGAVAVSLLMALASVTAAPHAAEKASISVSADSEKITVTASGFDGEAVIRGYKTNEYPPGISNGISEENMSAGEQEGTISSKKSITFSRYSSDGYDRLYERFAAVKDGIVISRYVYASAPKAKSIRLAQKSIKGIFSENSADTSYADDLKANSTVINIDTSSLPDMSGKSSITKKVNGKTYHFSKGAVRQIDALASAYAKKSMNVTAVCVNWGLSKVYGYSEMKNARVSGFNTSTDTGRDWFTAVMEFLADRYSQSTDQGLIQSYVIGNEIDTTGETYLCSNFETYMEEYYRCLRLADTAVKKYASDACVIVPFTHYWAESATEITGETNPSYSTKAIISWLAAKSRAEGDFDWGIAPHLYCSSLFESNYTGVDTSSGLVTHSQNSPELTYTNFEQLAEFLKDSSLTYDGQERSVYITEGGPSAGIDSDLARNEQAASLAFAYYKVSQYPFVREFNEYRLYDNPLESNIVRAGLMTEKKEKRPAYEVYKHIDQADTLDVSTPYLRYLSIAGSTWQDTITASLTEAESTDSSNAPLAEVPDAQPIVPSQPSSSPAATMTAPQTKYQKAVQKKTEKAPQKKKTKTKTKIKKKKVSLTPAKTTVAIGRKKKITLKNASGKITWKASSKAVSLSSKKGKTVTVKAKRTGKVTIKAKSKGKTYTAKITVKKKAKRRSGRVVHAIAELLARLKRKIKKL